MSMTNPAKRGARTVRTESNAKILCDCIARGMPFSMACSIAGLSVSVFHDWKANDENFRAQLEEAIALGVNRRLEKIEAAGRDDWRACAWLLEHCQPGHFARNRIEVTGADGTPLAAGVSLYLPQKDRPVVDAGAESPALLEERTDANGE